MNERELNFFELYLRNYLADSLDDRKDDEVFIAARSEAAEAEFISQRSNGLTVEQARELANKVLTEGL